MFARTLVNVDSRRHLEAGPESTVTTAYVVIAHWTRLENEPRALARWLGVQPRLASGAAGRAMVFRDFGVMSSGTDFTSTLTNANVAGCLFVRVLVNVDAIRLWSGASDRPSGPVGAWTAGAVVSVGDGD